MSLARAACDEKGDDGNAKHGAAADKDQAQGNRMHIRVRRSARTRGVRGRALPASVAEALESLSSAPATAAA